MASNVLDDKSTPHGKSSGLHGALVLGATGGLGKAYCQALASRHFHLLISGRDELALNALATELRDRYCVEVRTMVADLCQASDRDKVESALRENATLTWLVNAAGVAQWGAFMELPEDRQQQMFQINLLAPMQLLRFAIGEFRTRGGGTIIQVASGAAFFSVPFLAGYCATKGAIVQLLTSVGEEIRGESICLQALCPGFVKTKMFLRANADADRLPNWIWMTPERVVRESIRAAERNRLVCIPGKRYRMMLFGMRWAPTWVARRVAGKLFGNFPKYRVSI